MKKQKYLSQMKQVEQEVSDLTRKLEKLGWLRVICFLGAAFSVVCGYETKSKGYYLVGAVLLIGFIFLVSCYNQLKKKLDYEKAQKKVVEGYLHRLGKEWMDFKEDGTAYINQEEPRIKDLDLLGKGSLFQYICTSHTPYGKQLLAHDLTYGVDNQKIKGRQQAIKELKKTPKWTLHLQTLSQIMGESISGLQLNKDQFQLVMEAMRADKKQGIFLKILALVLPFITLFSFFLLLLKRQPEITYLVGSLGFILQLIISGFYYTKYRTDFFIVSELNLQIKTYESFLCAIEQKDFEGEYLKALKGKLGEKEELEKALRQLKQLAQAVDIRSNWIAYVVLSGLFMWDFHCKDVYDRWQGQNVDRVEEWIEVVAEMETLLSLMVVGEIKEKSAYPIIRENQQPFINGSNLYHPLIKEDKVVGNSLQLINDTVIITGSNMSGKTTFLRTIGINLMLAYAGGLILGDELEVSRMEVMTSMRIEDNVNAGISTFYAELLRIKRMITAAKKQEPMLVLIDEIFKGTNSMDRIIGAKATIEALEKPWIMMLISTHDFELCEMQNTSHRNRLNYHFTEYYKDNQIHFDYHLKEGRCHTTNAQYLLKMVGIINES